MGRKLLLPAVALSTIALVGCGSTRVVTTTETTTQTTTQITVQTVTRIVAAHQAPKPSPVANASPSSSGSLTVQDFNGNTLAVTADGLIDPATPTNASVTAPPAGDRFVALELTLKGEGPGTIQSDANSNATAIGSDGQDYTPQFGPITECTNFNEGNYSLLRGDTERGCVVFAIPTGVQVQSVQFSLGNGTVQFNK